MASSTSPFGEIGESAEKETVRAGNGYAAPVTNDQHAPFSNRQSELMAPRASGNVPAYTEIDSNPLPQIVFGDAMPEVVKPAPAVQPDADRRDFIGDPIPVQDSHEQSESQSSPRVPWYKRKSAVILAVSIVAIVGILAALFGTLGGLGVLSNNRGVSSPAATGQAPNSTSTSSPVTGTPTTSVESSASAGSSVSSSLAPFSVSAADIPPHRTTTNIIPTVSQPVSDAYPRMHGLLEVLAKYLDGLRQCRLPRHGFQPAGRQESGTMLRHLLHQHADGLQHVGVGS